MVQTDATNHTNDQRNYFKTEGNDKVGTNIRLITITYHDGNTPTTIKYNKLHTNTPITKNKQHLENWKNEYHPISYEKYNTETKTNLIPKYKPKTKNWQSPIVEKDDLIIEKNQKGPYTVHHDDDHLRLINNVKQENNYDNAKITDVFYDEKTKITEIIDPKLEKHKS